MDAEWSVKRNTLDSTDPAEKSHSVRAAHMSRTGSEEGLEAALPCQEDLRAAV